MLEYEARELYGEICSSLSGNTPVRMQQIGNGERVIVIDGYFFVWNMRDWFRYAHIWLGKRYTERYMAGLAKQAYYHNGDRERRSIYER